MTGESLSSQLAEAMGEPSLQQEQPQEQAEPIAADEGQPTEEPEATEAEPEAEAVGTLTGLAEELDVDPSALYDLSINFGEGADVESLTLGELKDAYAQAKGFKSGEAELEQRKQAFVNEQAQAKQQFEQQVALYQQQAQEQAKLPQEIQQADAQIAAIENQNASMNWGELEQLDAGEAALQKQKLTEMYSQAVRHRDGMMQQHQVNIQNQQSQYAQNMQAQTLQAIPEWSNPETLRHDQTAIINLGAEYGFQAAEIAELAYNPRLAKMIRDYTLMKGEVGGANANAKKKILEKGKLRAGTVRLGGKGRQAAALTKQAQRSGSKTDKYAAMKALMGDAGII